ncbi:MAG: KOW domain-containing RNA-binding protein [Firmicutes bacterium]|nr:KOW domain-containing RNA-binding protein [Bacillota bacterium]
MFSIGQIVYSKSGRDKGNPFVVVRTEGRYLFLADGRLRKLERPKKKKDIHVQKTNACPAGIKAALEQNLRLSDADVRKAIKAETGPPDGRGDHRLDKYEEAENV